MKALTLRNKIVLASIGSTLAVLPNVQASVLDPVRINVAPIALVWAGDGAGNAWLADFMLLGTSSAMAATGGGTDLMPGADMNALLTTTLTSADSTFATPTDDLLYGFTPPGTSTLTDGGTLGYLDAADTYTPFILNDTHDVTLSGSIQHAFYVASNCTFDITGQLTAPFAPPATSSLTDADVAFALDDFGAAPAVAPAIGGGLGAFAQAVGGLTVGSAVQDPGMPAALTGTLADVAAVTTLYDGTVRTALTPGSITNQSVGFLASYGIPTYDLSMGFGSNSFTVQYDVVAP
jgi:hypothetical protein